MQIKRQIPNIITAGNLVCGCLAISFVATNKIELAAYFVLLGALFDFFDGLVARALKVSSPLGAQLDSLSDMVTFGVVPAMLASKLLENVGITGFMMYLPYCIAVFSAFRLAQFNIDENQSDSFIGLPTPANALFWIAIPLLGLQQKEALGFIDTQSVYTFLTNSNSILIFSVLLSILMVFRVPLLALKFKSFKWKGNEFRWLLIMISLILFAILLFAAIPFILLLYLLLSIIYNRRKANEI